MLRNLFRWVDLANLLSFHDSQSIRHSFPVERT